MRKVPRDELMAEFGQRIRARREAKGLSQEELGECAELHRTYVGKLERGEVNPSLSNLVRLADGLDVDLGELTEGLTAKRAGRRRAAR